MYFPYQKGRYEVVPGLFQISKDFGNGAWDQRLIQLGEDFPKFRDQLEENRSKEPLNKYVCVSERADPLALGQTSHLIASELAKDYPESISYEQGVFKNVQTNEAFELLPDTNEIILRDGKLNYENAWDAIGAQIPEDLAIWKLNPDGSEEIEALHLNAPNHWAAQEKVGQSFAHVHKPVAHIEKIVPWAVNLLQGILDKGPFVRFAWGVGTDARLNHHPVPPPGVSEITWGGRRFDPANPKLYVRVERQALWAVPNLDRALFTIRTYFQDVSELKQSNPEAVKGLIEAILSMSPESLVYKGLAQDRDQVVEWLRK